MYYSLFLHQAKVKIFIRLSKPQKPWALKQFRFSENGGTCTVLSYLEILIKSSSVAFIQEKHLEISHLMCELIDSKIK